MKKQTLTIAAIALATTTVGAQTQYDGPPRGRDIDAGAGSCGAGPFGQTGKAGSYNPICRTMTDAERCLALIKGNLYLNNPSDQSQATDQYHFVPATGHEAQVMTYCLDHLRSQLLPTSSQGE